jgi:hypothetical protein
MEPVSNNNRPSPDDPTPAELEAGACLPREPEPLESRLTEALPSPAPAVTALVDKHPPSAAAVTPPRSSTSASPAKSPAHPGVALSIGINAATPSKTRGVEASLGIVVDLSEPKISVFSSSGSGKAVALGLSAGISGQASLVRDVTKFWGPGEELGVNLPRLGAAMNFTTPAPGGPIELNGVTGSVGASIGVDGHYYAGTTTERWSVSLHDVKDALKRAAGLPGPRRFGP